MVFEQAGPLGLKMGYRDQLGMSPRKGDSHGIPHPVITDIIPGGMAAGKDLQLGMTLEAVNGKSCEGMEMTAIMQLMKRVGRPLTLSFGEAARPKSMIDASVEVSGAREDAPLLGADAPSDGSGEGPTREISCTSPRGVVRSVVFLCSMCCEGLATCLNKAAGSSAEMAAEHLKTSSSSDDDEEEEDEDRNQRAE